MGLTVQVLCLARAKGLLWPTQLHSCWQGTASLPDCNNYPTKLKKFHSIIALHVYSSESSFSKNCNTKESSRNHQNDNGKTRECLLGFSHHILSCSCVFLFNSHPIMQKPLFSQFDGGQEQADWECNMIL